MGCCLSKNDPIYSSSPPSLPNPHPQSSNQVVKVNQKTENNIATVEADQKEEESLKREKEAVKKKEVFVIQHRKSSDKRPGVAPDSDGSASGSSNSTESGKKPDPNSGVGRNILEAAATGQAVRTSSCTKEEVDAILIQCGRLSRSSSGKGNGNGNGNRYCGSKRSYDFDQENEVSGDVKIEMNNNCGDGGEEDERLRRRQSRGSHRRRTTLSRSRERVEKEQQQQQRSGSRERGEISSGRRVSRSPQRRSESPLTNNGNSNSSGSGNGNGRPGKMVSVPATVSSLSIDKSNNGNGSGNGNGGDGGNVKRVFVKRNVGSPRSQSPARANQGNGNGNGNGSGGNQQRSQSPARTNQGNGNGSLGNQQRSQSPARVNQGNVNGNGNGNGANQQQPSLSRNGSRKAEQSPYRRTPLNEIDMNSLPFQPLANKRPLHKGKEIEEDVVVVKHPLNSVSQTKAGTHRRTSSRGAEGYEVTKTNYCRVNELQTPNVEHLTLPKGESFSPSDFDAMVTPVIVSGTDTLKLPQTLTRSRSSRRSRDLDINVDDALLTPNLPTNYNSLLLQDIHNFHQKSNSNNSNNSTNTPPFSLPPCLTKATSILEAVADLNSSTGGNRSNTQFSFHHGKKGVEGKKDPFVVESEVKVCDDLMEPSLHKYVTVRKRGGDLKEEEEEESSGSNSFVGSGQVNWVSSSSSWEPNSADSTDCWTSKSYTREEGFSSVGFQRQAISERNVDKNVMEHLQTGAARGRGPTTLTSTAAAASV